MPFRFDRRTFLDEYKSLVRLRLYRGRRRWPLRGKNFLTFLNYPGNRRRNKWDAEEPIRSISASPVSKNRKQFEKNNRFFFFLFPVGFNFFRLKNIKNILTGFIQLSSMQPHAHVAQDSTYLLSVLRKKVVDTTEYTVFFIKKSVFFWIFVIWIITQLRKKGHLREFFFFFF